MSVPVLLDDFEFAVYTNDPFIAPRLKVKRAKAHIAEFAVLAERFPQTQHYSFVIGANVDAGEVRITYLPQNRLPLDFSTILGDAIHNLRAAFDQTAVIISCPPFGDGDTKNVQFPTGKDIKKFVIARDGVPPVGNKKGIPSKMKGAGSHAIGLVDALKPYYGGDDTLRALHDLDIMDKHELIIPTVSRLYVARLGATFRDKAFTIEGTSFEPNEDGSNFDARISCPGISDTTEFKITGEFKATFDVVFPKGQPLDGQAIVPTLAKVADVAEGFIEACSKVFVLP